jgi:hypothetical protein
MAARLKQSKKAEVEALFCNPPFPAVAEVAKQVQLAAGSIYNQGVVDPEWYAHIQALREERRMTWLTQKQVEAVAALHDMTADALLVKTEHLKPYFTLRLPQVAAKASDYVLDHVIGKATERLELAGKDGGPIQTETKHEFDYDAYRRLFAEQARGDEPGSAAGDSPQ